MAFSDFNGVYSKLERSPMDRFKNKNRLLKSFGQNGMRIYELLDGQASAEEVLARIGIETDQFALIMEFMLTNGMIQSSNESAGVAPPASPSSSRPPPERRALTVGPSPPPSSPSDYSHYAPPSSSTPPASPSPSVRPGTPSDIPPASRRASPSAVSPLDLPLGNLPPQDRPRAPPSEGRISPDYASPPPYAPPAASPTPPRARPPYAATPPPGPDDEPTGPSHGSDEVPNAAAPSLSPLERIIFDKYGQVGVKVYNLIDGERTAEDILNETGISETKLVEILEFMNEQGIIKLERPARPPPAAPGPASGGFQPASGASGSLSPSVSGSPAYRSSSRPASSEEGVGFKPMVESEEEAARGNEGEGSNFPDVVPVDVPILPARLSLLQKAQMAGRLSMKFGKIGHDLMPHIDGIKDFVQLSLETGLALQDLDIILGELGQANLLTFKQLTRNEIAHRYGDDGLAVYKRFGRDGLIIYQMIGKAKSLREIAQKSHVEPARAVEMIIFIHKVLGLDLPLDRDTILRYLTKSE